MPAAALEVEIINKVTNIGAFAEEKAALSGALGGGFSPLGGGNVNFGGSLTAGEQRTAAAQLAEYETRAKGASVASRDLASEGNAVARAATAAGLGAENAAGRFAALGGVLGSSGAAGLGIGAGIIGLGLLYEAGKRMVENADKNETAQRGLSQAFESQGQNLKTYQGFIDAFINSNSKYISSEYEVKDAFAAGERAGFDYWQTQRLVNDALDLSAAKHIDLNTAMTALIDAEHGRTLGLISLGIAIKEIDNPQKDLTKAQKDAEIADKALTKAHDEQAKALRSLQEEEQRLHDKHSITANDTMHLQDLQNKYADATAKVTQATKDDRNAHDDLALAIANVNDKGNVNAQVLNQVEAKVKNARQSTSDLTQSQKELNTHWQKFGDEYGPRVNALLTEFTKDANDSLTNLQVFLGILTYDTGPAFGMLDSQLTNTILGWQTLTGAIAGANDQFNKWLGNSGGNPGGASRMNPYGKSQPNLGNGGTSTNGRQRGFGGALE